MFERERCSEYVVVVAIHSCPRLFTAESRQFKLHHSSKRSARAKLHRPAERPGTQFTSTIHRLPGLRVRGMLNVDGGEHFLLV